MPQFEAVFDPVVQTLIDDGILRTFSNPRGSPHPEWPGWAKLPHPSGKPVTLGCAAFIGDEPYHEPTPRQINTFNDFPLGQDDIRLRTQSVREAIKYYIPGQAFERWLQLYVRSLDLAAHFNPVSTVIKEHIPRQFNMYDPALSAPPDVVRDYLHGRPNVARYVLALSDTRREAAEHPDLLLALALYQAAHKPFMHQIGARLIVAFTEGRITGEELNNAYAVLERPFDQFYSFVIFATFLPLVLFKRQELLEKQSLPRHEATLRAITEAWETFEEERLLRRDFYTGDHMICPANQHLRYAKERRLIEGLYTYVVTHQHEMPVPLLMLEAHEAANKAVYAREYCYWHYLGLAYERNLTARGGQGLTPTRLPAA